MKVLFDSPEARNQVLNVKKILLLKIKYILENPELTKKGIKVIGM